MWFSFAVSLPGTKQDICLGALHVGDTLTSFPLELTCGGMK